MTYGVPYSFVPGTKARADEVNANFVDILNKIEDTNTRITEAGAEKDSDIQSVNEKIQNLETSKLNTSLSNLDSAGQQVLNNKADAWRLDGNWTSVNGEIASNVAIAPGNTHYYSLANIIPDSTYLYEFLLDGYIVTPAVSGAETYIYIGTDCISAMPVFRVRNSHNSVRCGTMQSLFLSGTSRLLYVQDQPGSLKNANYWLTVRAYRRVW